VEIGKQIGSAESLLVSIMKFQISNIGISAIFQALLSTLTHCSAGFRNCNCGVTLPVLVLLSIVHYKLKLTGSHECARSELSSLGQ
jgi:hypothetical protein